MLLAALFLQPDADAARRIAVRSTDYVEEGQDFSTRAKVALYRDFLARHPDVVLVPFQTQHLPRGILPTERSRLFFAMLGESGPDHIVSHPEDFQLHLQQNFLYPLDEYVFDVLKDRDGYPVHPEGHRLSPKKDDLFYRDRQTDKYSVAVPMARRISICPEWDKLSPLLRELSTRDGKIYGISIVRGFTCLIYRRDLFVAAGLNPDSPPKNWDELVYFAQKLTEPDKPIRGARVQKGQAGLACAIDAPSEWLNYLWQGGGDAVHKLKFCPDGHRLEVRKEVDFPQKCPLCRRGLLHARRSRAPAFDSNAGLLALQYYQILRSLRWTRCPRCGEPVSISPEAEKTAALTCNGPKGCEHTFPFPPANRIYRGLVREIEPYDAPDRGERAAELFIRGEAAMLMVSQPYAFVAKLPLSHEKVGMMPLPAGWEWVRCPRCRLPIILTSDMKEAGKAVCSHDSVPVDLSTARVHGGISANLIRVKVWGINSSSTKAARDALWRLIEYRMSDHAKVAITESLIDQGHYEAAPPSHLLLAGYRQLHQTLPESWVFTEQQSLASGRISPHAPNWSAFMTDDIATLLRDVGLGEDTDLKASLHETAKKCAVAIRTESLTAETKHSKGIAGILIPAAILLLVALWWLYRAVPRYRLPSAGAPATVGRRRSWAWLLLAPALVSLLLWVCLPLLKGGQMALFDWRAGGGERFIGVLNFADILSSPGFWRVLFQTFLFVLLTVVLGVAAPIVLALLLSEVPRGKHFFRTIFYLPALTTGLAVALLWKLIYDPTENGFLNWLLLHMPRPTYLILPFLLMVACAALSALFFTRREFIPGTVLLAFSIGLLLLIPRIRPLSRPINWLGNPDAGGLWSMVCIVVIGVWASAGLASIVYLAALRSIPEELYESAELDGAGAFAKIRHVTLAELRPLITVNLVGAVVGTFQAIRNIFVMTGGEPQGKTKVLALDLWYNAFVYLRFGYATALAWILVSLVIAFAVYHLKRLSLTEFRHVPMPPRVRGLGKLKPPATLQERT